MMYLAFLLSLGTIQAQEALVMIGGKYFDGYMDNEVEVWSHSAECELDIPSTPDSFSDSPGVALFQDNVYVCGGSRVGTSHSHDTCDVYSLKDKAWRQGPSLKSNSTQNGAARVHMATVGSVLLAAFETGQDRDISFNILDYNEMEWTEIFPLGSHSPLTVDWWSLVVFDEKHVGIHAIDVWNPHQEKTYIVDVEEGKEVATIVEDFSCNAPFMYKNNLTCNSWVTSTPEETYKLVALTHMDEGFTNPTWTDLGFTTPQAQRGIWVVLDGMLTNILPEDGLVYYREDEEWKMAELTIPRKETGILVMNCNN